MIFVHGMVWSQFARSEKWYWAEGKVSTDMSRWSLGASILMARNIFKK